MVFPWYLSSQSARLVTLGKILQFLQWKSMLLCSLVSWQLRHFPMCACACQVSVIFFLNDGSLNEHFTCFFFLHQANLFSMKEMWIDQGKFLTIITLKTLCEWTSALSEWTSAIVCLPMNSSSNEADFFFSFFFFFFFFFSFWSFLTSTYIHWFFFFFFELNAHVVQFWLGNKSINTMLKLCR